MLGQNGANAIKVTSTGISRISNVENQRVKECNRIDAMQVYRLNLHYLYRKFAHVYTNTGTSI